MKILHLISSGGMYGAEAVILQLCQQMRDDGIHNAVVGVFALAGHPSPELYEAARRAGLEAELIPCKGQLDFAVLPRLRALAARLGSDVIHAHGYKADVYAFLAFRGKFRPALMSTCHTWYDNDLAVRLYGALDRRVLRSFDRVVGVSHEVQQRLIGAGIPPEHLSLVRNGVSVPSSTRERPVLKQTLRVGLVGRLAPEKGVDLFSRAASQLVGKYPNADFVVAGEGPDRGALETLLQELTPAPRVFLTGQQTDMAGFYRSLDVLVSSSRQEGLPMALLEGMALGLPIVATEVGEVPRVVESGRTGLLVPAGSPDALAHAIGRLLEDSALRQQFGDAGRRRVVEHFSARRMTAEYIEIYEQARRTRPASQARATPPVEAR